jgi:hypothetical protein
MIRYAASIFLGAFLLFLVQPLLARYILPWYGGSPMVWTTSMLFFQVFLLAGYLYAHWIGTKLSRRAQAVLHLAVLAVSLTFLPITPGDAWKPLDSADPVAGILLLLVSSVGLPYLIVASSSPLLQRWVHIRQPKRSPYRLYALSNLGSLLGLVLYPFLVEPWLSLGRQSQVWSGAYVLYVALTGWCAVDLLRKRLEAKEAIKPFQLAGRRTIAPSERVFWLALAACGSAVLLATTNQMCQNVAVVPFLWVLPLALYLLSFIICFDHERWYDRRFWIPGMLASFAAVAILLKVTSSANIYLQIFIYSMTLFTGCMVCHGELARSKPPPAQLTSFYLMVATGGALGGVFVTLVAPLVFNGFWEFPLALFGCYVLAAISILSDLALLRGKRPWYVRRARDLWATGGSALILVFGHYIVSESANTLAMVRSFYGVLRVYEGYRDTTSWRRHLWNGDISHGCQFMDDALRRLPTHYYGFTSGVALAIDNHPRRDTGLNMGVVGLGAGTLAVYGQENDTIRFYEINPDVVDVAGEFFTFVEDSRAEVEIALGDARIAMERELREEGPQRFDVLALDAFSSDAIPIHLLTREAFDVYREHLEPDGVLAVHISNRHFNLEPVMRGLAREMGRDAVLITNEANDQNEVFMSDWVLITSNQELIDHPSVSEAFTSWGDDRHIVWTDDYSNLIGVLFD